MQKEEVGFFSPSRALGLCLPGGPLLDSSHPRNKGPCDLRQLQGALKNLLDSLKTLMIAKPVFI